MILLILQAIWYMVPAYIANMAPIFCNKNLKFLDVRVDFGKKLKGKPLFGAHKTWRGLFVAVIFGIILAFIQRLLYLDYTWIAKISLIDYSNWLLFGALMGAGAILGDLIESFFKRRISIDSGKSWPVFDQLDFVIGSLIATSFIFIPSINLFIAIIIISMLGHIIIRRIGYWLGINKEKF